MNRLRRHVLDSLADLLYSLRRRWGYETTWFDVVLVEWQYARTQERKRNDG